MADANRRKLLDGVRVLEFGQFIAAPLVTRMMADAGAEVIKVEMAPGGDTMRGFPPFFGGQSARLRPAKPRQAQRLPQSRQARGR